MRVIIKNFWLILIKKKRNKRSKELRIVKYNIKLTKLFFYSILF